MTGPTTDLTASATARAEARPGAWMTFSGELLAVAGVLDIS